VLERINIIAVSTAFPILLVRTLTSAFARLDIFIIERSVDRRGDVKFIEVHYSVLKRMVNVVV
jgi:hypothetical protein